MLAIDEAMNFKTLGMTQTTLVGLIQCTSMTSCLHYKS